MIKNIDKLKNNVVDLVCTDCNDCNILKDMLYKTSKELDTVISNNELNNSDEVNYIRNRVNLYNIKEKLALIEKIIDLINYDYNINDCFKNILKDIIVDIASLD